MQEPLVSMNKAHHKTSIVQTSKNNWEVKIGLSTVAESKKPFERGHWKPNAAAKLWQM